MLRRARSGLLLLLCVFVNAHLGAHESAAMPVLQMEDTDHGGDHEHPTTIKVTFDCHPRVVVVQPQGFVELTPSRRGHDVRDELTLGALRIEDDVGLYSLLLTYLI